MKFRTDFVTNSSSSSFTVSISFYLTDGSELNFTGNGGTPEVGREDYFDSEALVTVSPKQLGMASSVDEMIRLLTDGVVDDIYKGPVRIFERSNPVKMKYSDGRTLDAYDFILSIRDKVRSMDDIKAVAISGKEVNYRTYYRRYTYNRKSGRYYGTVYGHELEEIDGSSGGDLRFDTKGCEINNDSKPGEKTGYRSQNKYQGKTGYPRKTSYQDSRYPRIGEEWIDKADQIDCHKLEYTTTFLDDKEQKEVDDKLTALGAVSKGSMSRKIGLLVLKDKDAASGKTNRTLEIQEKYGSMPTVVTYGYLQKLLKNGKVFNSKKITAPEPVKEEKEEHREFKAPSLPASVAEPGRYSRVTARIRCRKLAALMAGYIDPERMSTDMGSYYLDPQTGTIRFDVIEREPEHAMSLEDCVELGARCYFIRTVLRDNQELYDEECYDRTEEFLNDTEEIEWSVTNYASGELRDRYVFDREKGIDNYTWT